MATAYREWLWTAHRRWIDCCCCCQAYPLALLFCSPCSAVWKWWPGDSLRCCRCSKWCRHLNCSLYRRYCGRSICPKGWLRTAAPNWIELDGCRSWMVDRSLTVSLHSTVMMWFGSPDCMGNAKSYSDLCYSRWSPAPQPLSRPAERKKMAQV